MFFGSAIGSDLSCEAYRRTLFQPYTVHVQRNSASVVSGITTHINSTIIALYSFLNMITSGIISIGLVLALLFVSPIAAIFTAVLFGLAYQLLASTSHHKLQSNSQKIAKASASQIKALQEGMGAIRDVLLDGSQYTYVQIYKFADKPQRKYQADNLYIGAYPRFILEALGIVTLILFGYFLVVQRGSETSAIAMLGALAFGAQRLLPALQHVYSGWAAINGYSESIVAVLSLLNQSLPTLPKSYSRFIFRESIKLSKIHFSYEADGIEILRGLSLEIKKGERIGIIGRTGSGKSTTIDILMGLLQPSSGSISVDGKNIHDINHPGYVQAWQSAISHVPQSIFLSDSSFAENIAFGVSPEMIDFERVKLSAKKARIAEMIESTPQGYSTFVGERGVRLSGGQRRIGIAKLYTEELRS